MTTVAANARVLSNNRGCYAGAVKPFSEAFVECEVCDTWCFLVGSRLKKAFEMYHIPTKNIEFNHCHKKIKNL